MEMKGINTFKALKTVSGTEEAPYKSECYFYSFHPVNSQGASAMVPGTESGMGDMTTGNEDLPLKMLRLGG